MIDLYYWPTANGHKVTIFLEEAGLPYKILPIHIGKGEQFSKDFLRISPNNKIPAMIDHTPMDKGQPISIFESGAMLLYLADKLNQFIGTNIRDRNEVLQWLFWQVAGLGPMLGQNHHFVQYAPQVIPYAIDRYIRETARLYAVLDNRLKDREFIAGRYSIADMACYPWIILYENQKQNLDEFPNVKRWMKLIQTRPAVQRAYTKGKEISTEFTMTEDAKRILFGQDANTIRTDKI